MRNTMFSAPGALPAWLTVAASVLLPSAASVGEEPQQSSFSPRKRILWTTSNIQGTPEPPPPYRIERVFAGLKFNEPVYLIAEPGSGHFLLVERKGKVYRFADRPDVDKAKPVLDLGHETYSLAFHPNYADNGVVFVFRNLLKDGRNWKNRISRFRVHRSGEWKIDPKSEVILLEWKARGHNGGDMAFGPDEMLYITSGDGETGVDDPDPEMTGQDLSDLRGGILRIDVDRRDRGKNYAIPADNPFIRWEGARPELWAFGLRNPWRFSFDRQSGRMWIGDNGEETWESIYLGRRGANYGWSVLEGSHPFNLARLAAPIPFEQPVVEHSHAESRSIMGGRVYRGRRFGQLQGVYVYGDHETGKVWGLRYEDGQLTWHRELADTKRKIIAFAEDQDGELLIVTLGGEIFRLAANEAPHNASRFPTRLSETGLFDSTAEHRPAPGLIPYDVNAPAWADGASIERFIALPGETQIQFENQRGWRFPDGAVLVQTFSLPAQSGGVRQRIETRLLHRHAGEWYGYSYRWNDEQTDATLVPAGGDSRKYDTGPVAGVPENERRKNLRTWHFPSRAQCIVCHSLWGPRYVIGVSTAQMNRSFDYGGERANQIDLLARLGIFEKPPPKAAEELPRLADPADESAALDGRARSYLHANCAHCHRYGGTGNARMRLGFDRPEKELRLFDVPPEHGDFGLTDAKLVAPGHPEWSVLLYRMAKLGRGHMPHLGASVIDPDGLSLIHAWIKQQEDGGAKPAIDDKLLKALRLLRDDAQPPEVRKRQVSRILSSTSGAMLLVDAIDQQRVGRSVKDAAIAAATKHPSPHVRDLFQRFLPEALRPKTLGDAIDPQQILSLRGNADEGRRLFFSAAALQCKSCHQVDGRGVATGPDLSRLAKRTTRAELLESLLEPSKVIEKDFQAYVVSTADGRLYSGLLMMKDEEKLLIKDARDNEIRIPAGEVESVKPQRQSLMPRGLLRNLTAQEAADLVEFLHALNATGSGE